MAYIRPLANNHFRADIRMKGIAKNKTFPTQILAQAWADKIEYSIKAIPNLEQAHTWHCLMLILIAWVVSNFQTVGC